MYRLRQCPRPMQLYSCIKHVINNMCPITIVVLPGEAVLHALVHSAMPRSNMHAAAKTKNQVVM